MEIPIVIEFAEAGYRARCVEPFVAEAFGDGRIEAREALRSILAGRIEVPFELLPLEALDGPAWIANAGTMRSDEATEEWLEAIAENRRERDASDQELLNPVLPALTIP